MNSNPLVLLASARPNGQTAAFVQQVFAAVEHQLLDLLAAPLYPYSYSGQYPPDDAFASIMHQVLTHETLVVATPVYWYAMSGLLKTFFDRLTDLVTVAKPLGRQLHGKHLLLLAVGADDALPPGFETPFLLTAKYFDMQYGGSLYYSQKNPPATASLTDAIQAFQTTIAARLARPRS